jgi:hypothetical protein
MYLVEFDPSSILRQLCPRQKHLRHHLNNFAGQVVTIDMKISAVYVLIHQRSNPPDDPNRPHDMVGVSVRDKHTAKPLKGNLRTLHLTQNAVASARVSQKEFVVRRAKQKAGIIAFGRHRRSRT